MTVEIPLSQGQVALVDDADAPAVLAFGKWHAYRKPRTYYAKRNVWINGRAVSFWMHRFITGFELVDHMNGDGLDNRRCNLRQATLDENAQNARLRRDNASGYKGVCWHKQSGRWVAAIQANGRPRHLGLFDDLAEAARAYDAAALNLHGEFARLNFPEENVA